MSYTERTYVTDLRNRLSTFLAELDAELVKQSRRPNRESEKRTRKLLGSFYAELYRPYKKESLDDSVSENSSTSQTEGV